MVRVAVRVGVRHPRIVGEAGAGGHLVPPQLPEHRLELRGVYGSFPRAVEAREDLIDLGPMRSCLDRDRTVAAVEFLLEQSSHGLGFGIRVGVGGWLCLEGELALGLGLGVRG